MMAKVKLGVLASGRGSNLQAIIDAVEKKELDIEINMVISDKEEAYVLKRAQAHSISACYINPKSFISKEEYEAEMVKLLKEAGVNLLALAGYMRIVGSTLLNSFPNQVLNIHPALLPAFPGLDGQKQALEYGVCYSGCTVHFVDEGMDTGPIILQSVVPVLADDTEDTLSARILAEEHKTYPKAIKLYSAGKLRIEGRKVRIIRE